jgi:TonB family protein
VDAVTEVVAARSGAADGLERMLGASALGHIALIATMMLAPAAWFGETPREPENVMTISLGGAPGPRDGGLATMGGRPIQQAVPPPEKKVVEAVRPPAARAPEMVEPTRSAPRKADPPIRDAPVDPKSATPITGQDVQKGSAVAETGGRGQGFGLSAGGGGASGYLDVANFCCPEYLSTMVDLITRRWDSKQQAPGTVVLKYVIRRDGLLTDIQVEKSSGYAALDLLASRALILTRQLPPLPDAFSEPALTVHLIFEYHR